MPAKLLLRPIYANMQSIYHEPHACKNYRLKLEKGIMPGETKYLYRKIAVAGGVINNESGQERRGIPGKGIPGRGIPGRGISRRGISRSWATALLLLDQ
jgi:hypothetical protein